MQINSSYNQATFGGKIRFKDYSGGKKTVTIDADDISVISNKMITTRHLVPGKNIHLAFLPTHDYEHRNTLSDILAAYNTAKANPAPDFVVEIED